MLGGGDGARLLRTELGSKFLELGRERRRVFKFLESGPSSVSGRMIAEAK